MFFVFLLGGEAVQADFVADRIPFSILTEDKTTSITGEVNLPAGAKCADGAPMLPAVLMVPGTGVFDRDVEFGNSGTEKDLLFKTIAGAITPLGIAAVRYDYRGVSCNRRSFSKESDYYNNCVNKEVRSKVTPENMRSDLRQIYDYAARINPCIDPDYITVLAHSEGSIHTGHLIHSKSIDPRALVFIGLVAESPLSLVRWQAIDRNVNRIMKFAKEGDSITWDELTRAGFAKPELEPKGTWTRKQLTEWWEKAFQSDRTGSLALPDSGVHQGFWSNKWWKFWWSDDQRILDLLSGYKGEIIDHGGDADNTVPSSRQFELIQKEISKFKIPPKLVNHPGMGHSLGAHPLVGPMSDDSLKLLVQDLARVSGVPENPLDRAPILAASEIQARPYLGVVFVLSQPLSTQLLKEAGSKSTHGLMLSTVLPGFPAWEGGLRVGDIIIAMNGEDVGLVPKTQVLAAYIHRVLGLKPDTAASVKILRPKPKSETGFETLELNVPIRLPRQLDSSQILGSLQGREPSSVVEKVSERLARYYGTEKDFKDLKRRIAAGAIRADAWRLSEINSIQHHPFLIQSEADALLRSVRVDGFLATASRLLSPKAAPLPGLAPLKSGLTPAAHLEQLKSVLNDASRSREEAFRALNPEEIDFLKDNAGVILKKFEEWSFFYLETDPAILERNGKFFTFASKVDLEPLIRAAHSLSRLANPKYIMGLKNDLSKAGLDLSKPELFNEKTPAGAIFIGGTGDNTYTDLDKRETAVLIDLGGNDYYANSVATATPKLPISIVIDREGNDTYETSADYSLASAVMGVGILADLAGNDSYTGVRGTQGFGMLGVGILTDQGGNDVYRAHSYAQGASFMGVGSLDDLGGNDRYESKIYSQACAIAGGIALLVDVKGNDHYYATGHYPSGYGTPGTFQGWSQGVGVGIRFIASGGIGILDDRGGKDVMESGDFSQGGGYWFGWGVLHSGGSESDSYSGNRYSQGFSAHSALGTFIDDGGNDFYDSRGEVSTGNANDFSVSWFEDRGGNDRYPAKHFSLGASANNSLGVFIDTGGMNRYEGPHAPGQGQSNEYHGGKSLSLFFDLGAGWKDQSSAAKSGYSFLFSKKARFQNFLRDDFLIPLLKPMK